MQAPPDGLESKKKQEKGKNLKRLNTFSKSKGGDLFENDEIRAKNTRGGGRNGSRVVYSNQRIKAPTQEKREGYKYQRGGLDTHITIAGGRKRNSHNKNRYRKCQHRRKKGSGEKIT